MQILYGNALQCTIFLVFPYGEKTNSADGLPTFQHATCNCPCEKHGNSRFIPHTSKDYPWDLLIDIANARRTGNWIHLNSKAKSVGIGSILGISTSSPLNFPMMQQLQSNFSYFFLQRLLFRCTISADANFIA